MKYRSVIALGLVLAATAACFGNANDTADTEPEAWCEDTEGGITDEVVNVMGDWSASFATHYFRESCDLGGLDESAFGFLEGAVEVDGYTPDGIKIIFQGDRENRLRGIIHPHGGISFSGQRPSAWGEMHIAISGHTYIDAGLDRTTIQGHAYVGLDTNDDGDIDCDIRGDWKGIKSGV